MIGLFRAAAQTAWKPDDLVQRESLTDFQLSPAEVGVVVWAKNAPDQDKDEYVSHLFRSAGGKVIQLTRGTESCRLPRFSPDGRTVAFLSARALPKSDEQPETKTDGEPKEQIWLAEGGEPFALTKISRKVLSFAWRDTNHIVFIAQEPPAQRERSFEEKKDKARVIEDETNEPPARLFEVERSSGKVIRLSTNTDRVSHLFVSPDGRHAVTFHNKSLRFEYDNQVRPQSFLIDLATGQTRRIFAEPRFNLRSIVWAQDSRSFYAANSFTTDPKYLQTWSTELWRYDLEISQESQVPLDWPRGIQAELAEEAGLEAMVAPLPDGFLALLADGVQTRVARYQFEGETWKRSFLEGPGADHIIALSSGLGPNAKTVAYLKSAANQPPDLFDASVKESRLEQPERILELNPDWKDKPKARVETIHWTGARQEQIEGLLYYPHQFQPGERRPLLLVIHGGPFWSDFDAWRESWHYPLQPHCERGAFILRANYHGSSGYGNAFADSIAGGTQYYDLPVEDLERGIDALIAQGLIDPERIGVMGWSNGAILTLALLTRHPDRYKAAAAGAGGFEWTADTSITSFGKSFNDYYFGKLPWEDPERYREVAPYYQADRITTPLLIFQGDADKTVPEHHAWMEFRSLQERTKTPVRLIIFPGEEHALKKLSNMRRKIEEELDWFDTYLYRTMTPPKPWIKEGSPLAALVARHKARREGRHFGVLVKGRLIPETVRFNGMNVGRFEVTEEQFSEYKQRQSKSQGRENLPATGIDFATANAYCQWLSDLTGETWRLPTAAEAEKLYEQHNSAENTLDEWAGYAPNREDTGQLLETVKTLGPDALLREVGSSAGTGSDPVFDLGGNVAEWIKLSDGRGRLEGGSADQPKDSLSRESRAKREYAGFRVIKE